MDAISGRARNALYFLYLGFFSTHWADSFVFLMCVLESLFSKEERGGATKTICSRVSKFLGSKERCEYKDIEELYNIRSDIVHGRRSAIDDRKENLRKLHELEYVVTECMKKMLDEEIYLIYDDVQKKEIYYNNMV